MTKAGEGSPVGSGRVGDERLERVRDGLAALPGQARTIYLLHARDGIALEDIAGQLGISVVDAITHLAAALVELSASLDDRLS